jgi:hypothetical protein
MTVRRLTQWTKQLCARIAARLRLTTPSEAERQPVLSGAASAHPSGSTGFTRPVTATHWLDDARRMRPRRVRSIPLPQPLTDETLEEKPVPPHPDPTVVRSPSSVNSLPLSTDRAARAPARESQPLRPEAPPDVAPAAQQPETDTQQGLDEKLRRRLRSLQFLVRHGVYNEGFARNSLPEQYHRSVGMTDDDELPF